MDPDDRLLLPFPLGHLEETDQHLHLGINVEVRVQESFAEFVVRLVHLTRAVVVFRQGDAQHAIARIHLQGLPVLRQRLLVFALLIVQFRQANLGTAGLPGTLQWPALPVLALQRSACFR